MSDGICIWTQHYDHARSLNNYTVPLTQQTCHLPLSVRDTHRGQCWEQQVELARTAETYLPVVEVNAVFVKRTRASRDVEFTTLTSAMEELGWMFAHTLKIRKGMNGAAPWWFCSAREPLCSCSSLSCTRLLSCNTCPRAQPREESAMNSLLSTLAFSWLLQYSHVRLP